ncbi:MAG: hypothetical protein EON93_23070 [Burkholderiales bacterium]|nr:MAG: hypothetical protein EON93_23070 [Burkholderiales bacterium]
MSAAMELAFSSVIFSVFVAATVFAGWKAGRPRKDSLKAQWISWPLVTVLAGAAAFFALIHVVNLMGFQTGAQAAQKYRL